MSERLKHKNVRSKTAQEIVNGNSLEKVLADYYDRYPAIEIDPDLDTYNLGEANDGIAQEYSKTLRAHFIEMGAFASLLSYELIDANNEALSRFTNYLEHDNLEASLSQYIERTGEVRLMRPLFPSPLKQYVKCVARLYTECREPALSPQNKLEKEYMYTKLETLHRRLHRLYRCLMASPYAETTSMPQRLLGFEPKDRGYSNLQEISLLKSRQAYIDVGIPFSGYSSNEIEACLGAESLFAASHAIEERYPGIGSKDVTRLLLKNVTLLSEIVRQRSSNKLYHSMVPDSNGLAAQGTFSAFLHEATVTEKMVLDDQDRLHIPVIPGNGKCPLGFVYEGSRERVGKAHLFYDSVQNKYNVEIARSPYIDLATEHMAMATITAEPFINGRAHQIIEDFKRSLFANAVFKEDLQKGDTRL